MGVIIIDLSRNIIKRYVEVATPEKITSTSDTVYGTVVNEGEDFFVMIDGSSILTPVSSSIDIKEGDRVLILVKNHEATIIGSPTSPTARLEELKKLEGAVGDFDTIIADKVGTGELVAIQALIDDLQASDVDITGKLNANTATIDYLVSENTTINGKLTGYQADIEELQADKIDATEVKAKYATIESLNATNLDVSNLEASFGDFKTLTSNKLTAHDADIEDLEANKLDVESAKVTYANIDFSNIGQAAIKKIFSDSGIIKDLIVSEGKITGELVGVTIKGDIIEGGTVKADRLVVKGENGLYYKLNTDGVTTEAEQTEYNSLDGSVITTKSITATKIAVDDLVAFDATIGGFNISDTAMYSGVKSSVDNTTQGLYFGKDGQMNVGDSSSYIKYYKDQTTGIWKLAISASDISFSSSQKTVEEYIDEKASEASTEAYNKAVAAEDTANAAKKEIDNMEIGGRNLVPVSRINTGRNVATTEAFELRNVWATPFISNENLVAILDPATKYTASFNLELIERTDVPTPFDMLVGFLIYNSKTGNSIPFSTHMPSSAEIGETQTVQVTFTTPNTWDCESVICYSRRWTTEGASPIGYDAFKVTNFKIEKGNRATDWTPAPEDIESDIDSAQETANQAEAIGTSAENRIILAESVINQLSDCISMLVVDSTGASLMMQTDDGWQFNIGDIQDSLNETSSNLDDLTKTVGSVENSVGILEDAVIDLGALAEYVRIGTYDNTETGNTEPCIELGERDSDFKLLITNTRIMFMEGSGTPTYIKDNTLVTNNVEVKTDLRQGNWTWSVRSNGNYGLTWKEV